MYINPKVWKRIVLLHRRFLWSGSKGGYQDFADLGGQRFVRNLGLVNLDLLVK